MEDYEKLGSFYLGRTYDMDAKKNKDELLLYDSKDLVTHAVCVGMTGSGKTGLCISLIEEAAIDGVPAILIDPKGDLANLMLTFPNLAGKDFLPWINLDDARQKGITPEDYANKQAETWKNGLASWGQDGTRIQRLRDTAEVLIYTPGSNAGLPVSIMSSFSMPPKEILEDEDLLRERINTTVTSLLGLVGIDADPMHSREHILLATIMDTAWKRGENLDLAAIIQQVQKPPVSRIGVLDLESFFSSKERFSLVLALNNLLASPGFNVWLQGTPLDIGEILYTATGKPRIAIFSISHLNDAERMFFVSLLMNQILGWMRGQSGTTSLRALVYMDEVFGFLPPVANPPSKMPMITLFKQARAFGIGMVLATQNPVDLDYKALSNAGTWFIGRLQTERDKSRLLDGLDSASAGSGKSFDRKQIEGILSALGNRVFLMNNTHEDAPEIFQTRWALSYLRGPLTRDQIKLLMDPIKKNSTPAESDTRTQAVSSYASPIVKDGTTTVPPLSPNIPTCYIPVRTSSPTGEVIYFPGILGAAKINYSSEKYKIAMNKSVVFTARITEAPVPVIWEDAQELDIPLADLEKSPRPNTSFADLPPAAGQNKNYTIWDKSFSDWLYTTQNINLFMSPSMNEVSNPSESERDFRLRIQQSSREFRDELVEKLREKYSTRLGTLQERLRKAQQAEEKQAEQARHAKLQTAVSFGSTLLGAFTGRKLSSSTISRASSTFRGVSRSMDESKDVARAGENTAAIQKQIEALKNEFDDEIANLESKSDTNAERLETITLKPNKSNIIVQLLTLAWVPYLQDPQGKTSPAW